MICELGGSRIEVKKEEIEIRISKNVLGKKRVENVLNLIEMIIEGCLGWLLKPSKTEEGKEGKRWKTKPIDSLSCVIYGLVIPPKNRLKKIYEAIEWVEIDRICEEAYKNEKRGAPAYAPQMMYRILVLMFASGTAFESETLRRLETDLLWKWFVGLSIWSKVPDKGTLSKFRKRIGVERFEKILVEIIKACDKAGLIGHIESYYDMTKVKASATAMTPYQRALILAKAMSDYLEKKGVREGMSKEEIAEIALEVLSDKHSSLKKVKVEQIVNSLSGLEKKLETKTGKEPKWWRQLKEKWVELKLKWAIKPAQKREELRAIGQQILPHLPQTFSNPEARVGRMNKREGLCGYRSGFLVDAKKRIITAVIFVAVTAHEATTLVPALSKHHAIFERYPSRLVLDGAFDEDGVHHQMAQWKIECVTTVRSRSGPKGVYRADQFWWNENKELICPQGAQLIKCGGPYPDASERYRATADCATCPLKQQCLTAKIQAKSKPRRELTIKTAAHQRAQEHRLRSYSPEGQALRHRRFASEGLFGHLNHYHNGDRGPYRSGAMDHIAQLMVASVSNLEQLAFQSGH